MKELLSTATNTLLVFQPEGTPIPMVEVVLILTEAVYRLDPPAEPGALHTLTRDRVASQVRFTADLRVLSALADAILETVTHAERQIAAAMTLPAAAPETQNPKP